ncbi:S1 family peptidase [Amycolatopsis suaedae]|uniref:Serine protease n=1 Tax=Amycolatopsis suaedae TaxID=2510978 RepID=A0A4Q7J9F4_9PSEU|nr:serine protease [Amycolatopsis suaedae]RZQ64391.1 serine protease [Amycolatopsis suaedae]
MKARSLFVGLVAGAAALLASTVGAGTAAADPVNPFIVGGSDADQDYSFMVSLQQGGQHFCGGSLIKADWVLTAAHCVEGTSPSAISARIGSRDRTSGGEEAKASEVIVHPDYNGSSPGGDIALVKLSAPAKSATVPQGSTIDPGTKSRLIGWGQTCPTRGGCGAPQILQQLDTQVVEASKCTGIDGKLELCTDNPGGDAGACYGDSGGPQIVQAGGKWELIGVTSRSGNNDPTCATGPSIYTSVPAYSSWIAEHTG